jgi:hypothetical protein
MDTMNVRGTKVEVHTTIDHNFAATWNNNYYSSPTWDGLRKKLLVASKNLKIEVPFFEVRNAAAGVATGIHTNSGNILVRWANGKTDQLSSWLLRSGSVLRGLSDEEVAEFVSLKAAVVAAEGALEEFRDARDINLKQAVLDALKALEASSTETD